MRYQKDRDKMIRSFEDTIRLCEREPYLLHRIEDTRGKIVVWQDSAIQLHSEGCKRFERTCEFETVNARGLSVARNQKKRLPDARVGIIDIASAWHPGGSVLRGEMGQEEELCRCTTLYPCLNTETLVHKYYERNRTIQTEGSIGSCLYVPNVVCLQEERPWTIQLTKEEWFLVDVIHCPMLAPLVGKREKEVEQWLKRAFWVAAQQKVDVLVFGRLGEDNHLIEDIVKTALQEYEYSFRAVYYCDTL